MPVSLEAPEESADILVTNIETIMICSIYLLIFYHFICK